MHLKRCSMASVLLMVLLMTAPQLDAQQAKVIRTTGKVAVINAGSNLGIKLGQYYTVYRYTNAHWKPFTYVRVNKLNNRISRVERISVAPQIAMKAGDRVLPAKTARNNNNALSNVNQPEMLIATRHPGSRIKGIYVGPMCGSFVPLGDLDDLFETSVNYGGILGIQLRPDLDVSARFLFSTHENNWSLWNVQLLGRRYTQDGFLVDLGYGVLYPQIDEGGYISLGFCGGFGFSFPLAYNAYIEFGVLYSYYPRFVRDTAQFLTTELRLIL
ncbi:hypothetical protein JW948_05265 [bacterium]|nr:hypothetical protein [bacterium]